MFQEVTDSQSDCSFHEIHPVEIIGLKENVSKSTSDCSDYVHNLDKHRDTDENSTLDDLFNKCVNMKDGVDSSPFKVTFILKDL